jgi:hypothetical protein
MEEANDNTSLSMAVLNLAVNYFLACIASESSFPECPSDQLKSNIVWIETVAIDENCQM